MSWRCSQSSPSSCCLAAPRGYAPQFENLCPMWAHFYWFSLVNGKIPTQNYRAFFFHLSYRISSVSAVGSIQPRWNNAEGRWTAVYFLIYYIRLHLTMEAKCAAEERNSGELMDQGGRFSARLEVEDCRGRFRCRGRESECCVLGEGDLQVNLGVYKTVDRRDWWRTSISVLREVSGIPSCFLSVNGSFSRLYFPYSSQFAVESCPVISSLTLLMLYTSASSQAQPHDPDLILKSTCSGLRLVLRTLFDTVIMEAMVF